jgi:hypothetical protein
VIPQVVKNTNIKFFDVPRLGSFMAVKMEYNSCLNEDSYDEGLDSYLEMNKKKVKQNEKKRLWNL